MKIYTRTGDDGSTGLADGSRLSKSALRVETMGAVDELNSVLGLLLTEPMPDRLRACLDGVQHDLFDLGGCRRRGIDQFNPGADDLLDKALKQRIMRTPQDERVDGVFFKRF